jgi:hypothetical protein
VERVTGSASRSATVAAAVEVGEGDVDAARFSARHGFQVVAPASQERSLYLSRDVGPSTDQVSIVS